MNLPFSSVVDIKESMQVEEFIIGSGLGRKFSGRKTHLIRIAPPSTPYACMESCRF